jgi:hypothetical protein
MDEIRIDQLHLTLSGLTEQDGHRLVRRLTELLGELLASAELPRARSIGGLRIELGPQHRSVEAISAHVAGEIVRQVQAASAEAGE